MKPRIAILATGLFLFVSGAYAILIYLDYTSGPATHELKHLREGIEGIWVVLLGVNSYFDWRNRKTYEAYNEPSPAKSGTIVVLATGLAAAVVLGWHAHSLVELMLPAAVALLTLVIAGVVYRFASKFKNEIGEARFTARRDGGTLG